MKYTSKFIPINSKIIQDRSYTEMSKYNSLLKDTPTVENGFFQSKNENDNDSNQDKDKDKNVNNPFVIAKWDYSNPNVLSVSTSDNQVSTDILYMIWTINFYICSLIETAI